MLVLLPFQLRRCKISVESEERRKRCIQRQEYGSWICVVSSSYSLLERMQIAIEVLVCSNLRTKRFRWEQWTAVRIRYIYVYYICNIDKPFHFVWEWFMWEEVWLGQGLGGGGKQNRECIKLSHLASLCDAVREHAADLFSVTSILRTLPGQAKGLGALIVSQKLQTMQNVSIVVAFHCIRGPRQQMRQFMHVEICWTVF